MRYRWHILAGSGMIAGVLLGFRCAAGLSLLTSDFVLGAGLWLLGWMLLFTDQAVLPAERFWWTGGLYSWRRYRGTAPDARHASIRGGTRAIGCLLSIPGWALMANELWRS